MKSALLTAAIVLSVLLGRPAIRAGVAPPVTNVCDALSQAVLVTPPASVSNLMWLTGRWECVDRALRWPPAATDVYAYLREMQFGDYSIQRFENRTGVYHLRADCTLIPFANGAKRQDQPIGIEFSSEGFLFGLPVVDVLWLKRDPAPIPEWFLLEHSTKKHVLLFRRPVRQVPALNRQDTRQTDYPLVLGGTNIKGVVATFHLLAFDSTNARVTGFVALSNTTRQTTSFGVSSAFIEHLRLTDSAGTDVPVALRAPRGHSYRLDYRIDPAETAKHEFDVDLREWWNLSPGVYRIGFWHDVRLFRLRLPDENPFFAWSTNTVEFRFHCAAFRPEVMELLRQIEADREAGEVVWDSSGEIIYVRLRRAVANERNLALLAGVNTLQRITLQAMPSDWTIGPAGFGSLAGLTNLTSLGLACGGELKRGTFAAICRLGQLRTLGLDAVYPPADDYGFLTNLRNLAELYVEHATNFGDLQLCLLTNLTNLRNVRFDQTAVSDKWVDLLPSFKSLTNIVVKKGVRSTNWVRSAKP